MRGEPQGRSEENNDKKLDHRDRYTSEDLHRALFDETPEHRTLEEMTEGLRQYIKSRRARS